jgi:hypothetical protein
MTVYGSCYNSRDCEDQYSRGTIQKESGSLKYAGNLIYGAILSEKESYECNVKRLLYRTSQIAETYLEKANLMDARGCATNLNADLLSFSQETMDATVDNLFELFEKGSLLKQKKEIERGGCGVW